MLVLILPMSISIVHAFHQHESNLCLAINESHYHSEITDCDQLHYFSQTVDSSKTSFKEISFEIILILNDFHTEFNLTNSFSKGYSNRGPPIITVF